jgi:hypothetical protein
MKRFAIPLLLSLAFCPALLAQEINHGEVGVFGDYFRLRQAISGNFWGLGGRVSVNTFKYAQLEAEMAYDFAQSFNEGFTNNINGTTTFQTSGARVIHGLFGPKFQTGGGAFRAFVVLKGGFIDMMFDNRPATFATFGDSVENLRSNNVSGVFYPGGGVEAFLGPVGLRVDIGDEIYYQGGPKHNLKLTVGPHIRF